MASRLLGRASGWTCALLLVLGAASARAEVVDVVGLTIGDIEEGLASGEFTSVELTVSSLLRIKRFEKNYNAFISFVPDVIANARALDLEYRTSGPRSPLHGVPVAVKDAMDLVGLPTTAGFAEWSSSAGGVDLFPALDAPVVARLKEAGAVIIGKTNLPAFAADGTRANSSFAGPTYNAYDPTIAPGASSSGSATAVAASFAVVSLAEETGGSIQNPAGAQSLVGIKPTFGLVPNVGVVPLAGSTRDVVGPLAKTVRDAAIVLDVLAGPSPEDPKTAVAAGKIPPGGYVGALDDSALEGARIGLFGTGFKGVTLTAETMGLYQQAIEAIEAEGAVTVPDPFAGTGFTDLSPPADEFDLRGIESIAYDMEQYLKRLGPDAAIGSVEESGIFEEDGFFGTFLFVPGLMESLEDLSVPPDLTSFFASRAEMVALFEQVMEDNDLDGFLFPQMFAPLPDLFSDGQYANTTVSEINVLGTPGVAVPAGYYADGSPFSVIFMGEAFSEPQLLALAYDYEQATLLREEPRLKKTRPFPPGDTKIAPKNNLLPSG